MIRGVLGEKLVSVLNSDKLPVDEVEEGVSTQVKKAKKQLKETDPRVIAGAIAIGSFLIGRLTKKRHK